MTDFAHLMRYNNANKKVTKNEVQQSNQFQIAPRYDLLDIDMRKEFGATDSKITNIEMAMEMKTQAISGPTNDNNET